MLQCVGEQALTDERQAGQRAVKVAGCRQGFSILVEQGSEADQQASVHNCDTCDVDSIGRVARRSVQDQCHQKGEVST